MDKSITVLIERLVRHPLYGKQYTESSKYTAHDQENEAKVGDKVTIREVRPISKTKSFTLDHVDEKSKGSVALKEDTV